MKVTYGNAVCNGALLYRIGLPSNTATPLIALFILRFVAVFVNKHASLRIRLLLTNYDKMGLVLDYTTG